MNFPSDILSCHDEIRRQYNETKLLRAEFERERQTLSRELTYYKEQAALLRAKLFGRSSEKGVVEDAAKQLLLFEKKEAENPEPGRRHEIRYTREVRSRVEGKLPEGVRFPEHLRREETVIDEGEERGEIISHKVTERLAAEPSQFFVKRTVRVVRKAEDGTIVTPALVPALIERTTVDVSFLVYVALAKFVWHLPLYRQERMLRAQGIFISRDTLIRYVHAVAGLLKPLYAALGEAVFSLDHMYADETPVQVGKGKHGQRQFSQSYFWVFLGSSGAFFHYSATRGFKEIEALLSTYEGALQSDGYSVYESVSRKFPEITLVGCWAHVRRKFVDAEKGGNAPEAQEALRYIRALYRVEKRICDRKLEGDQIVRLRQRLSGRILRLFERWLDEKTADPRLVPNGLFFSALGYARNRWEALTRYLDDAQYTIDSNAVEREIRPVALGRKNWLFCASEVGAHSSAILYSLIASCRISDVDPAEYLSDVLERISEHPASRVTELIPANWKKLREETPPDHNST